jgi:xylan 1,4-beta-xylosidase
MMKHTIELEGQEGVKLGGVLTWAFTFPGTSYFAGYRALATNGINLPVLSAFKLLGRLDGTRLPLTSSGARALDDVLANGVRDQPEVDGMATRNGAAIQVIAWNYHDEIVTVPATPVHLAIKVPASFGPRAKISHWRVDELHGDAYPVWLSQGMPASPTEAQIAALRQAMDPSLLVPDRTVVVAPSGEVEVDFDLPRFGVSLVDILPAASASDGGAGDAGNASSASSGNESCACRVGHRGHDAGSRAALFGAGGLVLIAAVRRQSKHRVVERQCALPRSYTNAVG